MTTSPRTKKLHLDSDAGLVTSVAFGRHNFVVHLLEGNFELVAPFAVRWADGTAAVYDPAAPTGGPLAHRLLDSLVGSRVTESVAGVERCDLRVTFDNGVAFELAASSVSPHNWYAMNPNQVQFLGRTTGELEWWGEYADDEEDEEDAREPSALAAPTEGFPPAAAAAPQSIAATDENDSARTLELGITGHLYGVTVYGSGIQLETREGSIYLAGPVHVTDADGEVFELDPTKLIDDTVAGAILAVLIDHRIQSTVLRPDTSEFALTLSGKARLDWKASSPAQAQFSAKASNGRQFWSKGDGTIYWFGGPQGTHPRFLVGAPKESE